MKFLSTQAGGYTVLIAVAVAGFLAVHYVLKKDVTDTAGALQHPFGQAFDDWFNNLVGGPTTPATPADNIAPNFGLTDPNNWN
jgi:hypothetical protein